MCVAQLPALEVFAAPTINLLDHLNGPLESEFQWAQMSNCYAPVAINRESTTMLGTSESLTQS